jgi:hypothetical protein
MWKYSVPKRRADPPSNIVPLRVVPPGVGLSRARIRLGIAGRIHVHDRKPNGVSVIATRSAYVLLALRNTLDVLARKLAG